jgi:hypothetical protein
LEKVRSHVCDAIAARARPKWNNNRPDFVNQAVGQGELRILGLGLREGLLDLFEWHSPSLFGESRAAHSSMRRTDRDSNQLDTIMPPAVPPLA